MDKEADGAHIESDCAAHVNGIRSCYGKKQQNFLSKNILAAFFGGLFGLVLEGFWCLIQHGRWENHMIFIWEPLCGIYGYGAAGCYIGAVLLKKLPLICPVSVIFFYRYSCGACGWFPVGSWFTYESLGLQRYFYEYQWLCESKNGSLVGYIRNFI